MSNPFAKRKTFFNNAAMLYIMTAAQYVFPLLTFPYLTRVLGPDYYGIVTYLTATLTYVRVLNKFGFGLSSTKLVAQSQDDKARVGVILGTTIQASSFISMITISIYTIFVFTIPIMRQHMLMAYLYLIGATLEILLPDFLFLGLQRTSSITMRYIAAETLSTALTFVLVRSPNDIYLIPLLYIAGNILAASLVWYQILFSFRIRPRLSRLRDAFMMLKDSSVYFFSQFATSLYTTTNTFVLGILSFPAAQISYWSTSANMVSAARNLYNPITNSLYPHMIRKKDTKLIRWLLFGLFPVIIVGVAGVFIMARFFIDLLCGPGYEDAVPVFRALLPLLVIAFPVMVIGFPVLGAFGLVKQITKSTIIASVFHIAGIVVLTAIGRFSLINLALLRCGTEVVLLGGRSYFLLSYLRERKKRGLV